MGGKPRSVHVDQIRRWKAEITPKRARASVFFRPSGFGLRTRISANAFRIFPARPLPYGTTERPVVRQSQRDCVLQPRVAESARLPWVNARAIFNPNGVVPPLRQRATTPLGLADTTRFSQGSSRLATLGFGAESLWDSLIIPKGMGSIPSGIVPEVCSTHLVRGLGKSLRTVRQPHQRE